ncbi:MAG TPA: YjgN family protein [Candidatus Sulfotelmatobacter sp.]|nr:YjgN family protein [Candidatus Sulfotelmatobacter sp.]
MDAKLESVAAPEAAAVDYAPTGSLALLLVKNAALTIVTLGIYRFWAKNALRRHFWGSIRIAGEPLEYTGRGIELFIGFLIVLGVFIGFALVQGLVHVLALTNPVAAGLLQLANIIAIALLVQAAIFRARRYRLSRTRWRGIRAGQDGSTWRYIGLAVGYGMMAGFTLGLAVPRMRVVLEGYVMSNTRFGDRHFSFEAKARKLLPVWLPFYGIVLATLVAIGFLVIPDLMHLLQNRNPQDPAALATAVRLTIGYLALILVVGFGSIVYRVAEFRYFTRSTGLGDIRFGSTARARRILLTVLVYLLGILVVNIVLAIVAFLVVAGVERTFGVPAPARDFTAVTVVFGVAALAVNYVLAYLWLYAPLLKYLCRTFEVQNIAAADTIVQSSAPAPRFGEGLADAFDIGVI